MISVLFYSDAAEFGGHEAMTLEAVKCLSQRSDVAVYAVFHEGNSRLGHGLKEIAKRTDNLTAVATQSQSRILQALRSLISFKEIGRIQRLMRANRPARGRSFSGSDRR